MTHLSAVGLHTSPRELDGAPLPIQGTDADVIEILEAIAASFNHQQLPRLWG